MILMYNEIEFDVRGVTYSVYINRLFNSYTCSLHLWGSDLDLSLGFSVEDFEGMSEADFYELMDKEYREAFAQSQKLLEGN